MSIYGCALCIPSKNVGFPLNYSRLETDMSPASPAFAGGFSTTEPSEKPF